MKNLLDREEIVSGIKNVFLHNEQFSSIRSQINEINDSTSLINDLALDSIQILELIVGIENEFKISCNAEELNLSMFDNFSDLVRFIQKKIESK